MPTYRPLSIGIELDRSDLSDLISFVWKENGIKAEFLIPGDAARLLRVSFSKPCIVRLLDEMPLSTEIDLSPNSGLISYNFAYAVEGSSFLEAQSWAWREIFKPVSHFRFITGSCCMDVASQASPVFTTTAKG